MHEDAGDRDWCSDAKYVPRAERTLEQILIKIQNIKDFDGKRLHIHQEAGLRLLNEFGYLTPELLKLACEYCKKTRRRKS